MPGIEPRITSTDRPESFVADSEAQLTEHGAIGAIQSTPFFHSGLAAEVLAAGPAPSRTAASAFSPPK
jgi:hypothetical protein